MGTMLNVVAYQWNSRDSQRFRLKTCQFTSREGKSPAVRSRVEPSWFAKCWSPRGCPTKRSSLSVVFVPETSLCVACPSHTTMITHRNIPCYRNSLVFLSEKTGISVGKFLQVISSSA